jgi:hypothetical protein
MDVADATMNGTGLRMMQRDVLNKKLLEQRITEPTVRSYRAVNRPAHPAVSKLAVLLDALSEGKPPPKP